MLQGTLRKQYNFEMSHTWQKAVPRDALYYFGHLKNNFFHGFEFYIYLALSVKFSKNSVTPSTDLTIVSALTKINQDSKAKLEEVREKKISY